MTITHDVNVRVLSQKKQAELNEPLCPPPDVGLLLLPLNAAISIESFRWGYRLMQRYISCFRIYRI